MDTPDRYHYFTKTDRHLSSTITSALRSRWVKRLLYNVWRAHSYDLVVDVAGDQQILNNGRGSEISVIVLVSGISGDDIECRLFKIDAMI